jgi:cell wall-associated NlpC family hydrolase
MPLTISALFRYLVAAGAVVALLSGCASTGGRSLPSDVVVERLQSHYRTWYGTPYRLGGSTRSGVDCSAFVRAIYRDVFNLELPRHTADQARSGRRVGRGRLRSGDLVFFKTGWFGYHVGVYVGNGRFIHASESRGVIESSLSSSYWSQRYWKARRVV